MIDRKIAKFIKNLPEKRKYAKIIKQNKPYPPMLTIKLFKSGDKYNFSVYDNHTNKLDDNRADELLIKGVEVKFLADLESVYFCKSDNTYYPLVVCKQLVVNTKIEKCLLLDEDFYEYEVGYTPMASRGLEGITPIPPLATKGLPHIKPRGGPPPPPPPMPLAPLVKKYDPIVLKKKKDSVVGIGGDKEKEFQVTTSDLLGAMKSLKKAPPIKPKKTYSCEMEKALKKKFKKKRKKIKESQKDV